MAKRKIFDSVQAKKIFVRKRRAAAALFAVVLAGILYYFYQQGLLYDYRTEYFLRDVKTGFENSQWGLVWNALLGILWRLDVLFFVLSVGVATSLFLWAYRNIARKFVFSCPKCKQAVRLFDSWICEYCPKENFHTIKYNLFTKKAVAMPKIPISAQTRNVLKFCR